MPALYKDHNISNRPEDHGIGGASSGAIAAFTVAWERPDHFRKVLSMLRGGPVSTDVNDKVERGFREPATTNP